jgi:hypothetical protein
MLFGARLPVRLQRHLPADQMRLRLVPDRLLKPFDHLGKDIP